jgi:hypothetical protein
LFRGVSVRNRLRFAGPGVLNRSSCHNEEELFTFDDKHSVHPLRYFSFVEADKVWWFDIRTIWEQSLLNKNPTNPYTREPLSIETRKRLRRLVYLNIRQKVSMQHDTERKFTQDEMASRNWLQVSQIIEENGFYEIDPLIFTSMNKPQLYIFLSIAFQDLKAWAGEHLNRYSRRYKYLVWGKITLNQYLTTPETGYYSLLVSRYLLAILNDCLDHYPINFIIMSAFYRL